MLSHCLFSEVMRCSASPNFAIRPGRASVSSSYRVRVGGREREGGGGGRTRVGSPPCFRI